MIIQKNTRNLLLFLILIILITIIGCFSIEKFVNVTRSYIFVPAGNGRNYIPYLNTLEALETFVDKNNKNKNNGKQGDKNNGKQGDKNNGKQGDKNNGKQGVREGFTVLEMSPMVPIDVIKESSDAVPSSITNTEISQGMLLPTTKEMIVDRGGNGVVKSTEYMSVTDLRENNNNTGVSISDPEKLFLPLSDRFKPVDRGYGIIGDVDSEECYKADFQNKLQKTGNYRQMTNNYKHKYPDSCSGIPQEFIASFYQ